MEETAGHVHSALCYGTWVLTCGLEEHTHTEECMPAAALEDTYICGKEEHAHTEACYGEDGELVCTLEEHTHTEECQPSSALTEEEQAQVDAVIALIDALPTSGEVESTLDGFDAAEDYDGYEAYYVEIHTQGRAAKEAYDALTDEQKLCVTNYQRLTDLEWLWSAEILALTPTNGFSYASHLNGKSFALIIDRRDGTSQPYALTNSSQQVTISGTQYSMLHGEACDTQYLDNTCYTVCPNATIWTFTAVTDGTDGQYYVTDPNGQYLKIGYRTAGVTSAKTATTIAWHDVTVSGIRKQEYVLYQGDYALNQNGGTASDHFGGYGSNHFTDTGNRFYLGHVENLDRESFHLISCTDGRDNLYGGSEDSSWLHKADYTSNYKLSLADRLQNHVHPDNSGIYYGPENTLDGEYTNVTFENGSYTTLDHSLTEWTFTYANGGYQIQNSAGKYLDISTTQLSNADNRQLVLSDSPCTFQVELAKDCNGVIVYKFLQTEGSTTFAINRHTGSEGHWFAGYVNTKPEYTQDTSNWFVLLPTENVKTAQIHTVPAATLNATLQVFDYSNPSVSVGNNTVDSNFIFCNSEAHWADTKDGIYWKIEDGAPAAAPVMAPTPGADGYPAVTGIQLPGPNDYSVSGSMDYLFDSTYRVGSMSGGGGLFQQDADGYYYYYSSQNAAYYNSAANQFVLYQETVRPDYREFKNGNFLPFNELTPYTVASYEDGQYVLTGVETSSGDGRTNLWFGMSLEFDFMMPKDGTLNGNGMSFHFNGDDDVFVYIDDVLVLDVGGIHGALSGDIWFDTGKVQYTRHAHWQDETYTKTLKEIFEGAKVESDFDGDTFADYTKHTVKFFYMERGGNVSNCELKFNMPTLPDKSLTVTKELTTDGTADSDVTDFISDTLSYRFRVVKADDSGNATDELFIKPGTAYTLLKDGIVSGTGNVSADGTFSLKAHESAQFDGMLEMGQGATSYIVQEIMPKDLTGQYSGVEYTVSGKGGSTTQEQGPTTNFTAFQTGVLSVESTQLVTYRNKVDVSKLGTLKITKQIAAGSQFDENQTFPIQVTLGGNLLPVGTAYTVDGESRTVTTAGQIDLKASETAEITGILSGTSYLVTELSTDGVKYNASYSGTVNGGVVNCGSTGASGEFPLDGVVSITVTNASYDIDVEIPISKQALDNDASAAFTFHVEQVENGTWNTVQALPGTSIKVTNDAVTGGTVVIGYKGGTTGTFYYKISEDKGTDSFIYDDTFYIVEVTADGSKASVTRVLKNGVTEVTVNTPLSFVNRKTTGLIVKKVVEGTTTNTGFAFTATVTLDGEPVAIPQPGDGAKYSVSENVASFTLAHNEQVYISGLPIGAVVTVQETGHDNFFASYTIGTFPVQQGDTAELTLTSSIPTVTFHNSAGYELPKTGGTGTHLYTIGGALLMAAAGILWYNQNKRRKEEKASS